MKSQNRTIKLQSPYNYETKMHNYSVAGVVFSILQLYTWSNYSVKFLNDIITKVHLKFAIH